MKITAFGEADFVPSTRLLITRFGVRQGLHAGAEAAWRDPLTKESPDPPDFGSPEWRAAYRVAWHQLREELVECRRCRLKLQEAWAIHHVDDRLRALAVDVFDLPTAFVERGSPPWQWRWAEAEPPRRGEADGRDLE